MYLISPDTRYETWSETLNMKPDFLICAASHDLHNFGFEFYFLIKFISDTERIWDLPSAALLHTAHNIKGIC